MKTQNDFNEIEEFLEVELGNFKKINFTGGRAYSIYKHFSEKFTANLLDEFESNFKGTQALYRIYKNKEIPHCLIVNIGTGTSVLLVKDSFRHLGGSALGGGFFMGIIKSLYNMYDFKEAIKLAQAGNRYNIDLKVSDIYEAKDHRVNLIFKELTAASFGKIREHTEFESIKKEDIINSLVSMIGENLGTISNLMADNQDIKNIIYCGGFLKDNGILKRILTAVSKFNGKKAIFIKNSEYCGAIGAMLS
jgi:type II pantothenate kinase